MGVSSRKANGGRARGVSQRFETGVARRIPRAEESVAVQVRLNRLEWLSWVMDRSIPIGRWRIGLDPILGLIPGLGDWIGAMASIYVLYESARLGAPGSLLVRMTGNILIETILGAVPVLGDAFDFVWQANTRNLALVQKHFQPDWESRPLRAVWVAVLVVVLIVLALVVSLAYLLLMFAVDYYRR